MLVERFDRRLARLVGLPFSQDQRIEFRPVFVGGKEGGLRGRRADAEILAAKAAGVEAAGGGAVSGEAFGARGRKGGPIDRKALARTIRDAVFGGAARRALAPIGKAERGPVGRLAIGARHAPGATGGQRRQRECE